MAEKAPSPLPEVKKPETKEKLPVPNGVENLRVQKTRKYEETKEKLRKVRAKEKVEGEETTEKIDTLLDINILGSGTDLGPGDFPKKNNNCVESTEFKKEKEVEKEALDDLSEKHKSEVASVKELGSLEGLDQETKKAVHAEIVRLGLNPEKTPQEFVDGARAEVVGPNGVGPTTTEQNVEIQELAVKKQAEKLLSDYQKAIEEDKKATPPGKSAEGMLQKIDPAISDTLSLKVIGQGHIDKKIGDETSMEIVERVLSERNLDEYLEIFGKDSFDIREVPIEIRKQLFLNPNFSIPESIKENIDGLKLSFGTGEFPVDRSDFPEGSEGEKSFQEATEKVIKDYTGLDGEEAIQEMQKMKNIPEVQKFVGGEGNDFKNISPFLKLLLDLFSGFGVALEEAGLLEGDFWKKYVAGKKAVGGNTEYTQDGGSSSSFEVGKTITGGEMISSAEKYMGRPYLMGGRGRLNVPGDPIDCSGLVVNSLTDLGCVPNGFDTTAAGFASRSEKAGQMSGQVGDFLIRTDGGPGHQNHIAIIIGGPDAQGNYQTIESTSRNPAGSGVIKTNRQASPDGVKDGFSVYRNPFLHGNKPEWNTDENIPEGGEEKNIVPTHYWHEKKYDAGLDHWTAKGQTKSQVSLFDKSGNGITPETHGYGFCAVDPAIIPFGSLVIANGKKYYAVDIGSDVIDKTAAKARGFNSTPVIDFYSKNPVGIEGKGHSMNVRIVSPDKSDRSLEELKKGYVPQRIPEIASTLSGQAKEIVSTALDACSRGDVLGAAHCTDWVDKVFKKSTGSSVYNASMRYNGVTKVKGGTGLGGNQAPAASVSRIIAGQHLILDKPGGNGSYGVGRTHSAIALGSPDSNGHIKVVSWPGSGVPKIEVYDLTPPSNGSRDIGVQKNGKVIRIQGA